MFIILSYKRRESVEGGFILYDNQHKVSIVLGYAQVADYDFDLPGRENPVSGAIAGCDKFGKKELVEKNPPAKDL